MGMGFAPTWLRQVSPPASQNHFNHWLSLEHKTVTAATWRSAEASSRLVKPMVERRLGGITSAERGRRPGHLMACTSLQYY